MAPNFMAPRPRTVEPVAKCRKRRATSRYLSPESRPITAHRRAPVGRSRRYDPGWRPMHGEAGRHVPRTTLPSCVQALGNLGRLGDAAPFCDQARDIGARRQKTAFVQRFDMESNCCFMHGGHLSPSHLHTEFSGFRTDLRKQESVSVRDFGSVSVSMTMSGRWVSRPPLVRARVPALPGRRRSLTPPRFPRAFCLSSPTRQC